MLEAKGSEQRGLERNGRLDYRDRFYDVRPSVFCPSHLPFVSAQFMRHMCGTNKFPLSRTARRSLTQKSIFLKGGVTPMRLLATLVLLALPSTARAIQMAVNCSSTDDCADGETCVAGDSATSIQACVAGAVCGGSTSGNCPSDANSGQLACIMRDGIYKCLSIDRCDQYFGGSSCSDGCNVNGVQCNGQGSCSLVSGSDGSPTFGCTCNDGFSGDKCESGSSTSSGSTTTSNSGSKASGSSSSTSSTASSTSEASTSSSSPDASTSSSTSSSKTSTSSSKSTSSSVSGSSSSSTSSSNSISGSNSFSSSVNGSLSSSSSSSVASSNSGEENTNVNPASANSGSVASASDSGGTSSAVFIIIGVLAACIIVGALMFAMYSRKKKREQEAEAGGFGGGAAFGATAAAGENEFGGGTGADTPKSSIVTM